MSAPVRPLIDRLVRLPQAQRARLTKALTPKDAAMLSFSWRGFRARGEQLAPDDTDWFVWFILAGRGFGKTRSGAEWIREEVELGRAASIALVGPTRGEVRKTMVEGPSGILACSPPWFRPVYKPALKKIIWPNGAVAHTYTAEEPEIRGPNHDTAWWDEPMHSKHLYPLWSNLQLTLRVPGARRPRVIFTGTPLPSPFLKELMADADTRVTYGSTFANAANLDRRFIKDMMRKLSGTRLGRQELYGEILGDNPDALFHMVDINLHRVVNPRLMPAMVKVVVAVDPAATSNKDSDETGIIVAGLGEDGFVYVLQDLSGKVPADVWGARVIKAFKEHGADTVVIETNYARDLVLYVLRTIDKSIPIAEVNAKVSKERRADPVAALYRAKPSGVRHVGQFGRLESEMTEWIPGVTRASPNRLDALLWAVYYLCLGETRPDPRKALEGLAELNTGWESAQSLDPMGRGLGDDFYDRLEQLLEQLRNDPANDVTKVRRLAA